MERRLAAIFVTDMVGYSRLMELDEARAIARQKMHRAEIIDPKISVHGGRIVKTTGDGLLVEFSSVVAAVQCALEVQKLIAECEADVPEDWRIQYRIGINLGDIVIDGDDILGDGVNVAARLEGLARPGGICISGTVHDPVAGKVDVAFEDGGEQCLKNVSRPVRVWHWRASRPSSAASDPGKPPQLPNKPSIAVLPFENMSGDPEQDYFADGMVEDIIAALSRIRWLFVIARNSAFTYKGRAVDVKQVGRELGVRYVLEGSVRKAGNRVRITGQLVDASTATHLWADRLDGNLEDVFDLQDQVSERVAGAIGPKLEQAEIERPKQKPTDSLDAYDYHLQGMASVHVWTKEANDEALRQFDRAIALDHDYATAYGTAAYCYVLRKLNGWMTDRRKEIGEAVRLARRAVSLGKDDAIALSRGGHAIGFLSGELDDAMACLDRALWLDPNSAPAWFLSGWVKIFRGEPDEAIDRFERAMRLSPLDPILCSMQNGIGFVHFLAGRYDEASLWAERSFREQPNYLPATCVFAASHALAGRLDKAQEATARLRKIDPTLRGSNLGDWYPLRRTDDLVRLKEGLRRAGLPD